MLGAAVIVLLIALLQTYARAETRDVMARRQVSTHQPADRSARVLPFSGAYYVPYALRVEGVSGDGRSGQLVEATEAGNRLGSA